MAPAKFNMKFVEILVGGCSGGMSLVFGSVVSATVLTVPPGSMPC